MGCTDFKIQRFIFIFPIIYIYIHRYIPILYIHIEEYHIVYIYIVGGFNHLEKYESQMGR